MTLEEMLLDSIDKWCAQNAATLAPTLEGCQDSFCNVDKAQVGAPRNLQDQAGSLASAVSLLHGIKSQPGAGSDRVKDDGQDPAEKVGVVRH